MASIVGTKKTTIMKSDHNHMNAVNKKDNFAIEQNAAEKSRKIAIETLRKIKEKNQLLK